MKYINVVIGILVATMTLTGCISFSRYEVPRVDQAIEGNQGVLCGEAPQTQKSEVEPTREMVKVDIELLDFSDMKLSKPTFDKEKTPDKEMIGNRGYIQGKTFSQEPRKQEIPKKKKWNIWPFKGKKQPSVTYAEAEEAEVIEEVMSEEEASVFDIYVVKRGETLSEISAKPEIYGTSKKWKKIYEANQDKIKDPNKIKAGQKLKIPRD